MLDMLVRGFCALLLVVFTPVCPASAIGREARVFCAPAVSSLSSREQQLWTSPRRDSKFAAMLRTASGNCEASLPPEPLATPNPLLDVAEPNSRVSVSFIIGVDGRVHSPFILESAGPTEDRTILDTVRSWRYRPAMCNGAATDTEAKVEFSSR
jgi:TonB family protein